MGIEFLNGRRDTQPGTRTFELTAEQRRKIGGALRIGAAMMEALQKPRAEVNDALALADWIAGDLEDTAA